MIDKDGGAGFIPDRTFQHFHRSHPGCTVIISIIITLSIFTIVKVVVVIIVVVVVVVIVVVVAVVVVVVVVLVISFVVLTIFIFVINYCHHNHYRQTFEYLAAYLSTLITFVEAVK